MIKTIISIAFFCFVPFIINAQLIIKTVGDNNTSPSNIVDNVFLGTGVEVTNINYFGSDSAIGIFENGKEFIGLNRGIVLSTGLISSVNQNAEAFADTGIQNDMTEDEDLEALAGININDVAKVEISFIPTSDTLNFRYVFASEEYPQFNCELTNDAFAFFIEGPNPSGGNYNFENLALIPDPNNLGNFLNIPVSINTVNDGTNLSGDSTNCNLTFDQYYNKTPQNLPPVFNGYLDVFIAQANVIPCEEYTIKIVIADGKDDQFDSAVFLEEKSFSTNNLTIANNNPGLDGGISEGCQDGQITLSINGIRTNQYVIGLRALSDLNLDQIAIPGIDFVDLPPELIIPQGSNSAVLDLIALTDGEIEDTELIYIEITTDACNVDTITIPITENSLSNLEIPDTISICYNIKDTIRASFGDEMPLSGVRKFVSTSAQTINSTDTIVSSILVDGLQKTDLTPDIISEICIDSLVHTQLNDLNIFIQAPQGQLLELSSNNGDRPDNETQQDSFINTCFNVNANININGGNALIGQMDLSNTTYTETYLPEGTWNSWLIPNSSVSNGIYNLIIINESGMFEGKLLSWSIAFESEYDLSYNWFPTNGLIPCDCDSVIFKLKDSQYYYLSVTDSYGCSKLDSTWIDVDPLPMTPDIISCESNSTSTVTFSWEPTVDYHEYEIRIKTANLWIPTNTGEVNLYNGYQTEATLDNEFIISGLFPEEEIFVVFHALNENGCTSNFDTIYCQSQPCLGNIPVIDSIIVDQPLCDNITRVPVRIFATDPDMPLTYRINLNNAYTIENTTGVFDQIPQGTWPVRIIDSSGCVILDSIRVNDPLPFSFQTHVQNIVCHNESNGSISVTPNGVFPPFTYLWDNINSTDSLINNLPASIYTVTVTDGVGCTETLTFNLDNPDPITYNYLQVDTINCLGTNQGSAFLNVNGGWEPYNILWSDGTSGPEVFNQGIGTAHFTITDFEGCAISDSSLIVQFETFDVSSTTSPIECFTDTIGVASVDATNGFPPYQYNWDNGETGSQAFELHAGINLVSVTDEEGCVVVHEVLIDSPEKLEIYFSPTIPSCIGASDGGVAIEITGGIGTPYDINWFDGSFSTNVQNLAAGEYCVTVTDGTGCDESACFNLPDAQRINLNANIKFADCFGNCNGAISVNPFGGSGSFNYAWSGPNNFSSLSKDIDNLCVGTYFLTVSESAEPSCFEVFEYEVDLISELQAFIQTNRFISCFGGNDGILLAVPSGGIADYEYEWSSNVISQNENAALNLSAGIYDLTITDANGCTNIASQTLVEPDSLTLNFSNVDVICFGENSGSSMLNIEGGTPEYITLWETGEETTFLNNLPAGNYSVTVTDRLGCQTIDKTLINEPPDSIKIIPEISTVTCFDGNDGQISIFTENTIEPVSYSLDNIDYKFDRTFVGLFSDFYTTYIIDDNGCTAELEVFIDQSPQLELDLGPSIVVFFGEEANLNVTVQNNKGDLSYIWSSPNGDIDFSCQECPNPIVSNITSSFVANVVVTDENECTGKQSINIFVDQEDQIDVPKIFTPNNDNINDRLNIFGSPDIVILSFKVYSRTGNLIFEGNNMVPNDLQNGWDGTFKNEIAPNGTYTWTAEYLLENGTTAFKSDQTTLLK
ncbi:MAG: choice-of-anchor L domain-containing protein [Bacteroidia bacterium]|nr:choice-of-anchor L domain-containing protein [Bacteroidia bacterium]